MNDVTCDKCGEITPVNSERRRHGENVVETYFNCTHCGAHYTGVIMDDTGRKLQRDVRAMQKRIDKEREKSPEGSVKEERLTRQLGALGKDIAQRMNKLKKRYVKEAM